MNIPYSLIFPLPHPFVRAEQHARQRDIALLALQETVEKNWDERILDSHHSFTSCGQT
jgi:hypothetical protein